MRHCRVPNPPNYARAVRDKRMLIAQIILSLAFPVYFILWCLEVV